MSKATSKMNKKELIEKIKQLEQEKHEDKERFIGAGQIIKKLQEENDKKSITLQQSGHTDFINTEKIKELCGFIHGLNLVDVFSKTIIRQRRTGRYVIDFSAVKKTIGEINCPDYEYMEKDKQIVKLQLN